ncbi:MAG: AAA family ATPase [Thermodesulfobacteriota bacterium]|nr:AAA family ATPase [Thermodesulfobacteriota bacterium]
MHILKRRLTVRLEHSLLTDRVTALMGPRQAGKTTLVRNLLRTTKDFQYYNLKDPIVRKLLTENGRQEFHHYRNSTIVLDEVQTVPALLELIQLQVDEYPEAKGQFLLLGSNHLLLNRHIKESLAGRVALFTLLPLSFGEQLENDEKTLLEQLTETEGMEECRAVLENFYIPVERTSHYQDIFTDLNMFGGYPEFLNRHNPRDKREWLSSYHQTYLETDLRQLVELRNPETFETFEQLFSQRVGNLMNISELARDCGRSADTIKRFIGYYRQLFISWRAKPYFSNPGKRMMKMSKYYFYDSGLFRSLVNDFTTLSGQYFENTVLTEIRKNLHFSSNDKELYFARTATGVEVDGFIKTPVSKCNLFVEIKQTDRNKKQDIKHLKKYVADDAEGVGILVNNSSRIEKMDERIWSVPAVWLLS